MSSEIGKTIKVSIFGESHSNAIGAVIEGIPAGQEIDLKKIEDFLERRAPGRNDISTSRKEPDKPVVLSGIYEGLTTGTPISVIIENKDTRSKDYEKIRRYPRPSHADQSAYAKYGDAHDIRGGGHFSGRLTAPLCIAGAICLQILEKKGIRVDAHISSIGNIDDDSFDPLDPSADMLKNREFPVINEEKGQEMKTEILNTKGRGDSVGGIVECCITGLPAGVGDPMFDGIENSISQAVFGIPAVKGIEFGSGFEGSRMYGSQNNDEFYYEGDVVKTKTNNSGGILGGISSGMPVLFKVGFKPTPSIAIQQDTVDLIEKKNTKVKIEGRHDPCIVPRAVPCVEAAAAIVILDKIYDGQRG